jgi:O-antigen ligase
MATITQSTASETLRAGATRGLVWIAAAVIFAAVGALGGLALAIGELDALWISLSVVAALVVLVDYRVGAVLLILMLPISDSNLFPHALMGMTGVNPVNLLLAGTLASYALRAGRGAYAGRLLQPQLIWLYVVPIIIGGALGAFHVDEIVPYFMEELVVSFHNVPGYLRDMVMKPLLIPLFALLLGVCVARSEKAERYIVPIALSVWIIALIEIVFVIYSGVRLGALASPMMRSFFQAIGLHANDLGRLFAIAYALLLFTWWETKNQALKTFLFVSMGVLSFALLLTFSRGAFVGFLLVNALFLAWKFNFKTAGLAIAAAAVSALLMPGYVYNRVLLGVGESADAVSAGRIEGIWLPLLPEVFKSPIWGNGLGSVMWSYPMQIDAMLTVGHPHNAFLETLLDMGLIGLVLLLLYYLHVWRGFRALGSNAFISPDLRGFFQGATAGLLCHLITGMAGSSLRPESEAVYLWMAIGMMYGLQARRPAEQTAAPVEPVRAPAKQAWRPAG